MSSGVLRIGVAVLAATALLLATLPRGGEPSVERDRTAGAPTRRIGADLPGVLDGSPPAAASSATTARRIEETVSAPTASATQLREWEVELDAPPGLESVLLELSVAPASDAPAIPRAAMIVLAGARRCVVRAAPGDRIVASGDEVITSHAIVPSEAATSISLPIVAREPLAGALFRAEDGAPLFDVGLHVAAMDDPTQVSTHRVGSDFELRPCMASPWRVRVEAAGRAPAELLDVRPGRALRIDLAAATTLRGCVIDPSGRPLAGAIVTVGRLGSLPVDERLVGAADAVGEFVLDPVPDEDLVLCARMDGFAPARLELRRDELASAAIQLRLELESRFSGRIVDEHGKPVAGARIVVGNLTDHFMTGFVHSDDDGGFAMPWTSAAADYHATVRAEGFSDADFGPFRPPCPALTLRLLALRDVDVFVTDLAGAAVAEATILAIALHGRDEHDHHSFLAPARRAVTGADGLGRLPWLARIPHQLVVTSPHGATATVRIDADRDATRPVTVGMPKCERRAVRWITPDGSPLAGIRMLPALRRPDGACSPLVSAEAVTTDADGRAALAVGAGPSEWWCERPDGALVIRTLATDCDQVDWLWPSTAALRIEVPGVDGARAAALHVLVVQSDGASRSVPIGPDGGAEIGALAAGPARVRLFDEWEASRWQSHLADERRVELIAGPPQTLAWPLIRERFAARVHGTPPADARLRVVALPLDGGASAPTSRASTSSVELDGRFVLAVGDQGAHDVIAVAETVHELWIDAWRGTPAASGDVVSLAWSPPDVRVRVPADAVVELLDREGTLFATARPDADGFVAVRRTGVADLRLRARSLRGTGPPMALGELRSREELEVAATAQIEATVRRGDASAVAGIVVAFEAVAPDAAPGAERFHVRTDRAGRATLAVPAGRYVARLGDRSTEALAAPSHPAHVTFTLD